jgi:hypothetical protein
MLLKRNENEDVRRRNIEIAIKPKDLPKNIMRTTSINTKENHPIHNIKNSPQIPKRPIINMVLPESHFYHTNTFIKHIPYQNTEKELRPQIVQPHYKNVEIKRKNQSSFKFSVPNDA